MSTVMTRASRSSTTRRTGPSGGRTAPMSEAEAAWVRKHAWTRAMRRTHRHCPAIHSKCPCQYGPCGSCSAGDHARCPYSLPEHAAWAATHADVPAGHVTYADTTIPSLGGPSTWQLWETGTTHDSRCPCARDNHHGWTPPASPGRQTTIYDFLDQHPTPGGEQ